MKHTSRRRDRHPVEQRPTVHRARVQRVPRQPLQPGEDLPRGQVPGGQPLDRPEHLELGVEPPPHVARGGGGDLLGDRHERHRDGHLDHRETPLPRGGQERPGQRRHHQALGQRQAGDPGVVEPLQVGALPLGGPGHADSRRHDHFGSEQPWRRILKLADVRPGHPPGPGRVSRGGHHCFGDEPSIGANCMLDRLANLAVIFEKGFGVLATLADSLALVGKPRARLLDHTGLNAEIDQFAAFRDAFAVHDVKVDNFKWRCHFIFYNLDTSLVANHLVPILDRADAPDVKAN